MFIILAFHSIKLLLKCILKKVNSQFPYLMYLKIKKIKRKYKMNLNILYWGNNLFPLLYHKYAMATLLTDSI